MYTFKKGTDIAQIEDNRVHLHIGVKIKEVDNTFLIEIPSLNISSYTVNEANIDKRINESTASFFKYWLKIEGEEKFIEYMLTLGFVLSGPSEVSPKKTINAEEKKQLFESLLGLGYSLSSSATTESNESTNSDTLKGEETKRTLDEELVIA